MTEDTGSMSNSEHVGHITWSCSTGSYVAGCRCGWTSDRTHQKEGDAQREVRRHVLECEEIE